MTLSDLERWGVRGQYFLVDLHNYSRTVWARVTEFGAVTQAEKHITRGSNTPISQGGRAPASPNFRDPYLLRKGLTHSDEICCSNTCRLVACFRWSAASPSQRVGAAASPEMLGPLRTVWRRTAHASQTIVVLPPTGSGPQKGRWAPRLYPVGVWHTLPYVRYAQAVWPRAMNFCMVPQVRHERLSTGPVMLPSKR